MYLRAAHAELHTPTLRRFIRENPLGILTTALQSSVYPLLQSSHIPWVLDVEDDTSDSELGVLRGHLARANPHAKSIIDTARAKSSNQLQDEVMILFTSPVQHYVTPQFYTATKPATGKVVPTWNYAAVQAYGRATVYVDAASDETTAFLTRQIDDLSHQAETEAMGYGSGGGKPPPWRTADSPARYVELLKKSIVGISVTVTRLEGKFKMSQELADGDRQGAIKGFQDLGTPVGREMAELIEARGKLKDMAKAK